MTQVINGQHSKLQYMYITTVYALASMLHCKFSMFFFNGPHLKPFVNLSVLLIHGKGNLQTLSVVLNDSMKLLIRIPRWFSASYFFVFSDVGCVRHS